MILEADEVVGVGHQILLPELDGGVGLLAGARVSQPYGLHRPEAQRVAPAPREFFNRQTSLEPARLLEALQWHALGGDERVVEARVLLFVHRTVEVVVAALAVARGAEGDFGVDRISRDDRRDGVVEVEARAARQPRDLFGQGVGAERAGGDDRYRVVGDARRLLADERDVRVRGDALRDEFGELVAVNGERRARGHARPTRRVEDDRACAPQLLFQKIRGRARLVRLQGVRADDLGKPVRPMRGRRTHGAHLKEAHARAEARGLPRGLRARESAADDYDFLHAFRDFAPAGYKPGLCRRTQTHSRAPIPERFREPLFYVLFG